MPIIKRYSNRKLYDTEAKQYITLEGIAELIRQEQEVHVFDHETGEDITEMTQAQIIFEQERKLKGGLPRVVLTGLIQAGNDTLSQLRRVLTPSADWNAHVNAEIERRVQMLIQQGDLPEEEGRQLIAKLIGAGELAPADSVSGEHTEFMPGRRSVPSRADVQKLARQLDALSAELDKLSRPPSSQR